MAAGLPCISFDCDSGPRDMIRSGVDGLLVPPEDVGELAATMNQLMSDEDLRRRLGAKATEVIAAIQPRSDLSTLGCSTDRMPVEEFKSL